MTDVFVTHNVAQLPPALAAWYAAVEQSRYFLAWEDDWDDEGSPAYDEAVWRRATDFLLRAATTLLERYHAVAPPPDIAHGPDGSIDIFWRDDNRVLLLNVPADVEELPTFYGRDEKGNTVKGELNLDSDGSWLLVWATR